MALTKKALILFEPQQYLKLKKEAEKRNTSIGSLIREVINKEISVENKISVKDKINIAKKFISANEDIQNWGKIEQEISKGYLND